jgi:predicted metalloprotease
VGHHVQRLTGVSQEAQRAMQRSGRVEANRISVRVELQADCYAGVWGAHAQRAGLLESGDVAEGIAAAEAVGDDRLQAAGQGRVVPESFTHGTAAQRREWFQRGFQSGDPATCDTLRGGI